MANQNEWLSRLRSEASSWVKEGLIDESQRKKIIAKYPDVPAATAAAPPPLPAKVAPTPKTSAKSRLPAVLVGLAALLVGVGLILFYAANWKKMPPTVKLAQVFGMIVLSYGGAFALLFGKHRWPSAGRALLLLGMLAFGAGIALVVQIYHISAHPAKCVLLWACFVAAVSAVMRERLGLYLALTLVLIWDIWERTVYGSPNYPMILAIATLFLLALWVKCTASRFICVFLAILWFYAVNLHYLVDVDSEETFALFGFLQIPFGVFLIGIAVALRDRIEEALAMMIRLVGWLAIYTPLILLSWPIKFNNQLIPWTPESQPFFIEFGVIAAIAGVLTVLAAMRGQTTWRFLAIGLIAGLALLFVPLDDRTILMTVMLIALLLFHAFTLLSGEQIQLKESSIMAFTLAMGSIFIHSLGHFALSFEKEHLLVASGLSGFLFVCVMFFMNVLIGKRKKNDGTLTGVFSIISLCVGVLILYVVSFIPEKQLGIFEARPAWMIPAATLALLAGGLGTFALSTVEMSRKLIIGAGLTTALAIALMCLPGEALHPSVRQLILNAMLFTIFGLVIAYGVEINSTTFVNLGAIAVVVLVMTRYFDVFWDMLHGSLFFIVTGVALFAIAGIMEWQRRRWLKQMKDRGEEVTNP